jgi:hypothetical protein
MSMIAASLCAVFVPRNAWERMKIVGMGSHSLAVPRNPAHHDFVPLVQAAVTWLPAAFPSIDSISEHLRYIPLRAARQSIIGAERLFFTCI